MVYHFMGFDLTNTQLIVAAVALVVVILIAVGAIVRNRRTRTLAFRNRFGSEYDRAGLTHGSPRKAEATLADRETRVEALKIRELGATERERFVVEWRAVQARFVDHPKSAVSEADVLISALLVALGYPKAGFEQRAADISVGYPKLMEDYRRANAIAVRPGRVDASTEELRKAMIQYRTIFDELVQVHKS